MPFIPSAALASGVQRQSETQTVTTDPDTFTVTPVFDCVLPAVVTLTTLATVFTPDGETFGTGIGELAGTPGGAEQSDDGIAWTQCSTLFALDQSHSIGGVFIAPGQYTIQMWATSRYLRFTLEIVDYNDFTIYAGPNHPTITVAVSALWV